MTRSMRRLGLQAALWAAPLGVALAMMALASSAPNFAPGPGVSAGDPRAWDAIWGALGLVGAGCATGLVATVTWLARAWQHTRRPTGLEWFRSAINLLFVVAFLWLWLG